MEWTARVDGPRAKKCHILLDREDKAPANASYVVGGQFQGEGKRLLNAKVELHRIWVAIESIDALLRKRRALRLRRVRIVQAQSRVQRPERSQILPADRQGGGVGPIPLRNPNA